MYHNGDGFKLSLKGIPQDEVDTALRVLLRSFNVISIIIRKSGSEVEP